MKIGSTALFCLLLAPSVLFAAPAGNVTAGKAVYVKNCSTCHGADGNGNATVAKMLDATIGPLSSKEVQALTDDDLKKRINEGQGKMKPVKGLSAGDVTNVIAFVRSLAQK